ncbi:GNAT family N-acetyltransferase [Vagococcus sp. BWB3-3]|uniref:GNAT family N-acetyltransferase n=1 Tax=Vagococcus allomyrinae TaxID=2794353 RepID=A0A940PGQ6_9ENTE|nr:GNAT family N-acetyltransferase [Vagococcus allomyrinae]MBP1044560.1 GNAT family N-acetyltransferase [Vagococcus allomyrinae]
MEFRLAEEADVLEILTIFTQTKAFFKEQKINQWQGDYPGIPEIRQDIHLNQCYVAVEKELILGVIVLSLTPEKSYDSLIGGAWNSENPYTVIHRLAINSNYQGRGTSLKLLAYIEEVTLHHGRHVIRTDTHESNDGMRYILTKTGYRNTGRLFLEDGSPRIGYDKLLDESIAEEVAE